MRITSKKTASDSRQQEMTNTRGIALIERGYWQKIVRLNKMMRIPINHLKQSLITVLTIMVSMTALSYASDLQAQEVLRKPLDAKLTSVHRTNHPDSNDSTETYYPSPGYMSALEFDQYIMQGDQYFYSQFQLQAFSPVIYKVLHDVKRNHFELQQIHLMKSILKEIKAMRDDYQNRDSVNNASGQNIHSHELQVVKTDKEKAEDTYALFLSEIEKIKPMRA